MRYLLLTVAVVLAVSGCGSGAGDLEKYLSSEWSTDSAYGGVDENAISVEDGAVVVGGTKKLTETSAMKVCGWVSEWVYDQGNGDDNWTITVKDETGRIMSKRAHANGACSFGDQ